MKQIIFILAAIPFLFIGCTTKTSHTVAATPTATPVVGSAWNTSPGTPAFSPREGHTMLAYDGLLWILAGEGAAKYNDVYYSINGLNWAAASSSAAFIARKNHSSAVFTTGGISKMWVIGGNDGVLLNDAWCSDDGASWAANTRNASFSPREGHSSEVFLGALWVIAGYDGSYTNDIFWSIDGASWITATTAAAFSARSEHASFVFNNKMYVSGGTNGADLKDIWSTSDGVNWYSSVTGPASGNVFGHTVVQYNNILYMIGGTRAGVALKQVYSSTDAVNWTNVGNIPLIRSNLAGAVFISRLYVAGGFDGTDPKNDIYFITN